MKRILLFALMFFSLTSSVFAQRRDRAVLKLRLSDRTPLSVNVDGRHFDEGGASITIGNLPAGPHRIEVFSEGGYRMRPRRVFTGTIRLAPETVSIGIIDLYNRGIRLRTRPMDAYTKGGDDRDRSVDNDRDDRYKDDNDRSYDIPKSDRDDYKDRDDRKDIDDVYGDNRSGNYHDNDNKGIEGYGSFPHGRDGNNEYNGSTVTQKDIADLRSRVADRITDSEKEKLMKNVMEGRRASTEQIREMLSWLSFESTRLDFAKWAYSHATDRKNYWKLEDVFTFSSSKDEFNDAIRTR